MLGGDIDHVAAAEPLLKSVGTYIKHVGPSGDGQAMKVVNNAIMAVGMATACEVSVLAQRLGLDPQVYFDIVTRSSGDSWVFRNWFPLPGVVETSRSSHGYEPGFMIDLIHKDLRLATATAAEFDVRLGRRCRGQAVRRRVGRGRWRARLHRACSHPGCRRREGHRLCMTWRLVLPIGRTSKPANYLTCRRSISCRFSPSFTDTSPTPSSWRSTVQSTVRTSASLPMRES
jgi:hypothetical protein